MRARRVIWPIVLVLAFSAAVEAQDVTVGFAAYHQYDTGDLGDFGRPRMTEIRVALPLSPRFAFEPFGDLRSYMFGARVRQRLESLTTPGGHYGYVTYGAATMIIGHVGAGWSQRLSPHVRLTTEVRLVTWAILPAGVIGVAGLSIGR